MTQKAKYMAIAAAIFIAIAAASYSYFIVFPREEIKRTKKSISVTENLIASQDKVVERIYTNTIREVNTRHEEIRREVQVMPPDTVARELNNLLSEYRKERGN